MERIQAFFMKSESIKAIILSLILIGLIQLLKYFISHLVNRNKNSSVSEKNNYKRNFKTYLNIIAVIILAALWFSQIQSVFISLFAVAAAIVLATKELIMCFMGGVLIHVNNSFKVGDRIEIDGSRGFVIQKNLTATKIIEIGPEKNSQQTTAGIIIIPNSIMLSKTIKNESYFNGYSIQSFGLYLPENVTLAEFEVQVIKWGQEVCGSYLKDAEKAIGSFCKKEGLNIPTLEPKTKVYIRDQNKIEVILKIPAQNQFLGDVEQGINRKFIALVESLPKQGI